MAVRPVVKNLNATSVGILNWVLADQSGYLAGAPAVQDTVQSIKQVGEFINAYQPRQNQFLSALVNRIGLVIVSSKSYSNPWQWIKRGTLEYGESLEEIYVNLAKVENFQPGGSTNELLADLFGRRLPDVQAAFHQMNFQKKYPVTVSEEQLRTAFTSMDGVNNLIEYIIQSLYTAFEYDELCVYQYMLGRLALDGKIKAFTINAVTDKASAEEAVIELKNVSDEMEFLKTDYNMAGVYTHTPKEDQYVIKSISVNNRLSVQVLAPAFNMGEVEFAGHQVLLDTYDDAKLARMAELLGDDDEFVAFTSDEVAELNKIKMFLIDREFLMQYDKLVKMSEQQVPNNLSWQYFLHHWAIFSASPFKNAAVFTTASSNITGITVSPDSATAYPGSTLSLTATVAGTGLYNSDVTWKLTGANKSGTKVSRDGVVTIAADETSDTLLVTVTSVAKPTVYGTAAISVTQPVTPTETETETETEQPTT